MNKNSHNTLRRSPEKQLPLCGDRRAFPIYWS